MYAAALKVPYYKAFSQGNPIICGYETMAQNSFKKFHTGKRALCACINLLRVVEIELFKAIQSSQYKPLIRSLLKLYFSIVLTL